MKTYVVFDTETISLNKPFCYNVGYVIVDIETNKTLLRKEFVIEQIWHNLPLFETAYYADKRQWYVGAMRSKQAKLTKWGYAMQEMLRDFKNFNVVSAYAYNSPFDTRVFEFCNDYFKTISPFDTINIYDIRGYVCEKIANTQEFKNFCEENNYFTENGNYSTTAETLYRYIVKDNEFIEHHTALSDSEIEKEILVYCLNLGCELEQNYNVPKSIRREILKTDIILVDKEEKLKVDYYSKITRKNKTFYNTVPKK